MKYPFLVLFFLSCVLLVGKRNIVLKMQYVAKGSTLKAVRRGEKQK